MEGVRGSLSNVSGRNQSKSFVFAEEEIETIFYEKIQDIEIWVQNFGVKNAISNTPQINLAIEILKTVQPMYNFKQIVILDELQDMENGLFGEVWVMTLAYFYHMFRQCLKSKQIDIGELDIYIKSKKEG